MSGFPGNPATAIWRITFNRHVTVHNHYNFSSKLLMQTKSKMQTLPSVKNKTYARMFATLYLASVKLGVSLISVFDLISHLFVSFVVFGKGF